MEIDVRLVDLSEMQQALAWDEIVCGAVAVLEPLSQGAIVDFRMELENVPGTSEPHHRFGISLEGIEANRVERVKRTHDRARLVEYAAIAMAGLALYHAGTLVIEAVANRGSRADYQVGTGRYLLEIAGRSRRGDLNAAWKRRRERLAGRSEEGFFLCVVEFESPAGRLGFFP